jgi:hypothetical protein
MFKPIQFRPDVEALVRFVEESDPASIVENTLEKLRAGTTPLQMITASALAIVRSTELPPNHHGGPLHPVCGVRAVSNTSKRLPGELSYLPVLQHTALCNNHTHSPQMGPFLMTELEPMAGSVGDVGSYHISDEALHAQATVTQTEATDNVSATKAAFEKSLLTHNSTASEHYYLWLLENLSEGEALDQLLPLAIARNNMDDHNFIYPVYTARALDELGWKWAKTLFRPAVRYQARQHKHLVSDFNYDFAGIEALLDEYKLLERDIPEDTTEAEAEVIGRLGAQMGSNKNYYGNVELMAKALADGLSLEGAGEALSYGSALAYLSTSYGNPMDSHLHTGTNNRRYLLSKKGVSRRSKVLALLTGFTGPEVLLAEALLNWESNIESSITQSLPARGQAQLLEALTESIESQPWLDWRSIGVDHVVAPEEVKETVALARQYADLGYDAGAYFECLAEVSCRDDFTEMHSLKHFQAIVDEYYATREPYRWVHMVAAAKSAAVTHVGKEHQIYHQAKGLLRH